jgi:hypothetical protein
MAKSSLLKGWRLAEASGTVPMDQEEIDREIAQVRTARQRRKAK